MNKESNAWFIVLMVVIAAFIAVVQAKVSLTAAAYFAAYTGTVIVAWSVYLYLIAKGKAAHSNRKSATRPSRSKP